MPLWALVSLERLLFISMIGTWLLYLICNHSTSHVKLFPFSLRGVSPALSVCSYVYWAQEATDKPSQMGFQYSGVCHSSAHAWHPVASPIKPSFKRKQLCCKYLLTTASGICKLLLCSCGSVVEHCVSSAKVVCLIPREHTYWQKKMYCLNTLSRFG